MAQNTTVQKGRCINFGNCSKANNHEEIEVNLGDDFICPECDGDLMAPPPNASFSPSIKWIVIIAGILVVLGAGVFFGFKYFADGEKSQDTDLIEPEQQETEPSYPITPDGITLDKTSLEFVDADTSKQLTATVFPYDVPEKNKTIIWRSGDETVATVDSSGLVTAVANGNAVISAYTRNGLSATCFVTVGEYEEMTEVTGVFLNKKSLSLSKGMTDSLTAKVEPSGVKDVMVFWTSDNSDAATVRQTGLVTAVAEGMANIIVIAADGKTDTCTVTVKNGNNNEGQSNEIIISNGTISFPGGSYTGQLKNGKPHNTGTIYYNSRTLIDSRDTKKRYAEAGYTLTGEFYEGRLLQGKLYDQDGEYLETIIIGRGAY